MDNNIIEKFSNWIIKEKHNLEKNKISILDIKKTSYDVVKRSVYVDILSGRYFSRITLWESGEIDLEKLLIDTGETVCYKSLIVDKSNCIDVCYNFIKNLG